MLRDEVIEKAVAIIQDGAYDSTPVEEILDWIVLDIATRVRVPDFKAIGVVTVNAGQTSLLVPDVLDNFQPRFVQVAQNSSTGKPLKVAPTLEALFAEYPDFTEEGDIESITFEGSMLWVQKVPQSEQTISFVYNRIPDTDTFNWIPVGLQYNLLVCGTVGVAFGEIEDGLETDEKDGRPNTTYYGGRYFSSIQSLREYYAKSRTHMLTSFWSE